MQETELKLKKAGEVRVRFAPSPTGFLHIGGARTALLNYVFAKREEGIFILRIEDTDVERSKEEFEDDIKESLKWLGLEWDEFYKQSERLEIYKKYLEKLLENDKAYYCFCTEEELEAHRQYLLSIGKPPVYSGKCANLDKETVEKYQKEGKNSVIRFRTPVKKIAFDDLVREKVEFDTELIGDFIIAKDLFLPLYNLAATVDDFETKISHVIRGEEHISNTPKQWLLQEALGFEHPEYGHLPLILAPDRSKLSKRHGAVSVKEFRELGYLPEALINYMAFLGWNPGTEREIYSLASLIRDFSLDRVQKGGAVFNITRLDWINGFYIRQKSPEKLTELCIPFLIQASLIEKIENNPGNPSPEELKLFEEKPQFKIVETGELLTIGDLLKIIGLYQTRIKKLSDIVTDCDFFFKEKLSYNKDLLKWKKMRDEEVSNSLDKIEKTFSKIEAVNWTNEGLEKALMPEAEKMEDRGYLLWPLRVALTGKEGSAGPFEIAEILGKQKTLHRIGEAKKLLRQ